MTSIASTFVFAFASIATTPMDAVISDFVDRIEVNHFYNEKGELVFDQLIFYEWSPIDSRFHVRAWRLMKDVKQPLQHDCSTGEYKVIFYDGGTLRKVRAPSVQHTWTQFDPEVAERKVLPVRFRRELTQSSNE